MCEKEPELKIAQQLVLEFYRILKTQNKSQLSSLFTRVHESGSAELRCVAAGMEADAAAICEAIVNATMFDRYLPFSCPLRYFRY